MNEDTGLLKERGIWVPIKLLIEVDFSWSFREAKILKKNGEWFTYIIVENEVEELKANPNRVIGIDVGDKNIATKVMLIDGEVGKPKFYEREVRGIRRHYDWLRRGLGEKRLLRVVKKIGSKEKEKLTISFIRFREKLLMKQKR